MQDLPTLGPLFLCSYPEHVVRALGSVQPPRWGSAADFRPAAAGGGTPELAAEAASGPGVPAAGDAVRVRVGSRWQLLLNPLRALGSPSSLGDLHGTI